MKHAAKETGLFLWYAFWTILLLVFVVWGSKSGLLSGSEAGFYDKVEGWSVNDRAAREHDAQWTQDYLDDNKYDGEGN